MARIEDRKDLQMTVSYMEIYNEKIFDLLAYAKEKV